MIKLIGQREPDLIVTEFQQLDLCIQVYVYEKINKYSVGIFGQYMCS